MLLAIDTATRLMSIALHDGNRLLAEQTLHVNREHSVLLAPTVKKMMQTCTVELTQLTALAVSIGPGSYSGLRIGVAFAKGMAAVRQLPLVGVSTLDTLAAGQPFYNTRSALLAVVQAGRGRIIAQKYRGRKGSWGSKGDPYITTWESLFENWEGHGYLTGEISEAGLEAVEAARARDVEVVLMPPAYRLRRAGFLAEEAQRRLQKASPEDFQPAKLLPIYLKSPDAS